MMSDVLEVIKQRRSIRAFKNEQISDEQLQTILQAALLAPSAMNQQKWHFSVVQDQGLLAEMVAIIKDSIMKSDNEFLKSRASNPNYHSFHHAPTVIMISGDEKAPWIDIDCAMAALNIALAAEALGLGSCIIGSAGPVFVSEQAARFKEKLGMPEGYKHVIAVSLGYKAGDNPAAPDRNRNVITYVK